VFLINQFRFNSLSRLYTKAFHNNCLPLNHNPSSRYSLLFHNIHIVNQHLYNPLHKHSYNPNPNHNTLFPLKSKLHYSNLF